MTAFLLVWAASALLGWCMWCGAVRTEAPADAEDWRAAWILLAVAVVLPLAGPAFFAGFRAGGGVRMTLRLWP